MRQAQTARGLARHAAGALHIGGLTALSTTDYPGQLSAVVFCQGCPWRCVYCHNPHLLNRRSSNEIAWKDIVALLERRRGLLDAVVFSGGEPTLQAGIADAMREVKQMGFRVGVHTAGVAPRRLEALLPLTDWVAMDIKAPFDAYAITTGRHASGEHAFESMQLILASGVDHEFRTTVHASLLPPDALTQLARSLAELGVRNYVLQEFRDKACASSALPGTASYLTEMFLSSMARWFSSFAVRRA
jgi:pyruvate formate lyase activating enzyme